MRSEAKLEFMKYKFLLKSLVISALVLALVRVVVSNIISTSGVELGRINEEIAQVKLQNDGLREEFFSKTSMENIATQAAKLGFTDKKENFVLTSPLPVALR